MSISELNGSFDKARKIFHPEEQFPAPTTEYVVKTKGPTVWREHKNARLQISVGQPNHEGEKLRATVEWVKTRFTKQKKSNVYVCINDSLQRWNFLFQGDDYDTAMQKAIQLGDDWIERNSSIINKLPNAQFTRWEIWRNKEGFERAFMEAHALYGTNKEFREAIDKNIDDFWNRQKDKKNLSEEDYEKFKHFSKEYLLEETAVFSLMFKEQPAVDIYPGDTLLPCVVFQGRTDVKGLPEGLGTGAFQRIDHSKNNSFINEFNGGVRNPTLSSLSSQSGRGFDEGTGPINVLGRMIAGNWHFANGGVKPALV